MINVNESIPLKLNLLLSGQVAKFLEVKPPQLVKLKDWDSDWDAPEHHWFSNWRVEDYIGVSRSQDRLLLVTNQSAKFSVLVRAKPKDFQGFFVAVHTRLMDSLDRIRVYRPARLQLQVMTLSGADRSLASFQNQLRYFVDGYTENIATFDEIEAQDRANEMITSTLDYGYPRDEFKRLCQEKPPFGEADLSGNIIPFPVRN